MHESREQETRRALVLSAWRRERSTSGRGALTPRVIFVEATEKRRWKGTIKFSKGKQIAEGHWDQRSSFEGEIMGLDKNLIMISLKNVLGLRVSCSIPTSRLSSLPKQQKFPATTSDCLWTIQVWLPPRFRNFHFGEVGFGEPRLLCRKT
jgi:hypothetical protein